MKKRTFKQTLLLVCLAAVLGGGTLGAGVGAGYTVARRLMEPPETESESFPAFSQPITAVEYKSPVTVPQNGFSGIIKTAAESVVSINVTSTTYNYFRQPYEAEGAGSGIIFADDGAKVYIATNNHVVEGVNSVSVSLDDDALVEAKIVGRDSQSDLAVLSVPKDELDALCVPYRVAVFGDSDAMDVGDLVVALGNSMGEGQVVTQGIISAINKQITVQGLTLDVIQTDAAINPGNSGGPLVNVNGEVIGIVAAKLFATDAESMGYCIPIKNAAEILETLRIEGSIKKPFIGVHYRAIDEETKELFNLPSTGVLVTAVEPDSPASDGGIEPRDIIVGYNKLTITSGEDLYQALGASKVDDAVTITVYRNNELLELNIILGDANSR